MPSEYPAMRPAQEQPEMECSAEREAGEVQRALQNEERVMIAAIKLPESGPISEDLKREVCERVKILRKNRKIPLTALTKQLGGPSSPAVLSEVLRRHYGADDDDHIRRLNAWCDGLERRTRALRPTGICDTNVLRLVRTGCDYAKSQGCMALLSGPAGIGKTVAAQIYAEEDMNSVYMRLTSTHTTATAFLHQLAQLCRVNAAGSRATLMDAITQRLKTSNRLLIFDEWHRAERPIYECVRDLHDICGSEEARTGLPIALVSTEEVLKRVTAARLRKGETWSDQFCSRVGFVVDLARATDQDGQPRPLFTMDEIREVFKSDRIRITPDGFAFLQALACSIGIGCLRMAQRCFSMAARMAHGRDVTAGMLRKAFRLQAIPEGVDDSALMLQVEETARTIRAYAAAG